RVRAAAALARRQVRVLLVLHQQVQAAAARDRGRHPRDLLLVIDAAEECAAGAGPGVGAGIVGVCDVAEAIDALVLVCGRRARAAGIMADLRVEADGPIDIDALIGVRRHAGEARDVCARRYRPGGRLQDPVALDWRVGAPGRHRDADRYRERGKRAIIAGPD